MDRLSLLLKHLAESIKDETDKPESRKDGSYLNRVRELKIVATLLDFVVTKTRYANKDFSKLAGESPERKNNYVEVWSILWELTKEFAKEATTYAWDNTKNERVKAQELLFKTARAQERYDASGLLTGGEELEVSVFERLMRSHAALFGSDVGVYKKVHDATSGKDEYKKDKDKDGKDIDISRAEEFSSLMSLVYDSYRLSIPEEPKKSENKENLLTVGKGTEKADYYKYSLKDLSALLDYVATSRDVKNFLTDSKSGGATVASAIQSKAELLHKYLLARETLANEEEALKVIRYIYDRRKNDAVPTRVELLKEPTLRNLYDAATGKSDIDGIWDAQIYLRYLFLLSSYERGGVRVVGTDDVFTLENYAEKAKKLLEQGVEDVLGLQKEEWPNKLENDWNTCFGKDFGTFGRHPRMGEVLPPAPEKLERVKTLNPASDKNLLKFLQISNGIEKDSAINVVSKLVEGGVNVLYYKSYTRLLERYYRPKSSSESSNFNFELYYEIVDSFNEEFKKQMTRVFPESGFDSFRHDDYRAKAEAARNALKINDVGSAAERELLTNDYDYLPRRARNLYLTQKMVASSRLSVYGDSSLSKRREEEARALEEAGAVKKERSGREQRRDYFQGKPNYISLSGVSVGDFPILDIDSLPNYSLDQYVEFVNYALVPYKKELEEYKNLALAYCNSDIDVEIAEIEIEAADTAVRITDLGVEIANKWVEIALINEEIAGLGVELANLENERDTIDLKGKMKALEFANMTSEALDLQVRGLTDFIENQALPKLEETKESLDKMCRDLLEQAKKIEDAQRRAAKRKRLFGALHAVVSVVGVAAAVFTGGASLAATSFVTTATTVANSAIKIAEAVDSGSIKFNSFANAAQSLTYIGKEAGAVMAACNIPEPEFVKDARAFIGDGIEKFNHIKSELADKYKGIQTAVVGNYEEFKDGAKTVVDSIKSEIDSKTSDLNAIGAAAQIKLLNGLDSLKNGDAFNTLKGLRDGSLGRVVRSLSNVGDQIDGVAKKFERFNLDSVKVMNLQGSLDKLAKNGLALKSNVLELKDQLPVELRDGIGTVGEKVADDLRVYIKNNAEVLFDDLIAQSSELRDSCEKKLKKIRDASETLGKDAKDLLAELEKAPKAFGDVFEETKTRVEEELAKLGLEEFLDGPDWSFDGLINEVQEGLIADVDRFCQDPADEVVKKLDDEIDQFVKDVASDYQKSVDEVVDSFLSEFDKATATINSASVEVALLVAEYRDVFEKTIRSKFEFNELETIVKDNVGNAIKNVRSKLVDDLKSALREEIASSVNAEKAKLTDAADSFKNRAQALKDDLDSFAKNGARMGEFKNRLREDIENFDPGAVKDQIGVVYGLCADDLENRIKEFQNNEIQGTIDSIQNECQSNVAYIRREIDNRVANAQNAIIPVKNEFTIALNTYVEARAAFQGVSARLETLVVNVGERVQDLPKKTNERLSTFAANLPGVLMPNPADLTLQAKDDVKESNSTMIGRVQVVADRVDQFKKDAVAIVDKANVNVETDAANENFLNRAISVEPHAAVEATIGDILKGPEGDNLVDFLVDAVRMNADMRVDESGSVVLATETLGSRGEELKRRAAIMDAAQSKLESIISDYTNSMQAINEKLKSAVDQAGSDPRKLRKVAEEDVQTAKDKFVACFDALKDKLNIMLGEQAEAKAKVEIAQIDVEVAKKQLEIDDVKIVIAKLNVKKAQKETEARKMEVAKAEMERDLAELNREATRARQEKAEFNNAVFAKKLQQWPGLPRTPSGDVDVEELKKQFLENKIKLEAPASTSVLGILDPTLPEEEILNSVLADFAGVLKWMKILNVDQRESIGNASSIDDKLSEDSATADKSQASSVNRFVVDNHDYMWYASEFCRLYGDEKTNKEELIDKMREWLGKIQHIYTTSGQNPRKRLFLSDHVSPNFPKGSYCETRYFVHLDKERYPGLLDEDDVQNAIKRIGEILKDDEKLKREKLGTIDDLDAKRELLEKEMNQLKSLKKTDDVAKELLPNGARLSWYYENIDGDDVASRIVQEKLGAPIAKIVVWFRPDGANSFYDALAGRKFGYYLGQESFTPYIMVNWIEMASLIEPEDSIDRITGLRYVVVDPEGSWVVAPNEQPAFSSQVVKNRSELDDEKALAAGFDARAKHFKLREFNGLWKIYIYEANPNKDVENKENVDFNGYFYGDEVDDPKVLISRLQRWQIHFRYVKANKK